MKWGQKSGNKYFSILFQNWKIFKLHSFPCFSETRRNPKKMNLTSRQTSKDDPNVLNNGLLPKVTHKHRRSGYITLGNATRYTGTPFKNNLNHNNCQ